MLETRRLLYVQRTALVYASIPTLEIHNTQGDSKCNRVDKKNNEWNFVPIGLELSQNRVLLLTSFLFFIWISKNQYGIIWWKKGEINYELNY